MKKGAYYNEFDPKAAAWLRQLIKNKLIADGEVDERSITEVMAEDIKNFKQHHFFAGIGGWSYALRLAGWSDDRPVCTASLPCQPFSVAGQQKGKADERHLLPHFIDLVKQCDFKTIFGEQVPGAIKHGWLDDLCAEMERENYAVGSIVLTASGAGAPHIRQRLYWVADVQHQQHEGVLYGHREEFSQNRERSAGESSGSVQAGFLDDTESQRRGILNAENIWAPYGTINAFANSGDSINIESSRLQAADAGQWDTPDWLYCRDNKWRPVKPGIKPLANGLPKGMGYSGDPSVPIDVDNTQEAKVMRLKGYGNAIVPQVAAQFISAFMECKK